MELLQKIRRFKAMFGSRKDKQKEDEAQELSDAAKKYAPGVPEKKAPSKNVETAPKQQKSAASSRHKGEEGNDFKKMHESWNRERLDILRANLLRIFDTDDDLPLSKHILLLVICGFFALFIGWSMMAELDEIARGQGEVVPSQDVQVVQTLEAGTVEEFLVKEGQEVERGQVLMRLSDIQASSDLGSRNARYYGLLAAITRLQAEAEGKMAPVFPDEVMKGAPQSVTEELNTFRANRLQLSNQTSVLEQQLAQRSQEVRGWQTRVNDAQNSIDLIKQERSMIAPLVERGTAPRMELIQLDQRINQAKSDLNGAQSSLRQAQGAVNEVRARVNEIESSAKAQAQTELSAKLIEMNEVKETLGALTQRKERTELVSPVKGKIQEINIKTVGGVVRPGDDIIKIVPLDDQLIIEAKIRPSDRAFIHPGLKAVVKITSYDFSIYGGLKAEVTDVSADTITDEKGNTFYRVRLLTQENKLKRRGKEYDIIIGMQASVDIITGKKTVLQYLLKPFIKTLDVAFTER